MDNKTKIGALLLAATVGGTITRLAAFPVQPEVRVVGMSFAPAVALTLVVDGKPVRLQCTDASGPVTKLAGKPFSAATELCTAMVKAASDAKASVGLMASEIADSVKQ